MCLLPHLNGYRIYIGRCWGKLDIKRRSLNKVLINNEKMMEVYRISNNFLEYFSDTIDKQKER